MKLTDSPIAGRIWAVAATLLMSYAGYDQYEKRTADSATTVNVNLESVPDNVTAHTHAAVVSEETIRRLIDEKISAQNAKNTALFKKKEPWE